MKYLIYSLLFLLTVQVHSQIPPKQDPSPLINDFGNIIDDAAQERLKQEHKRLEKELGIQFTIVSVDSLGEYSVEDFANKLFNTWGIGQAEEDNGLLLLVAVKNKAIKIEVGYGLESIIPDIYAKKIITEEIIPAFKENNYSNGIESASVALIQKLELEYTRKNQSSSISPSNLISTFYLLFLFIMAAYHVQHMTVYRTNLYKKENGSRNNESRYLFCFLIPLGFFAGSDWNWELGLIPALLVYPLTLIKFPSYTRKTSWEKALQISFHLVLWSTFLINYLSIFSILSSLKSLASTSLYLALAWTAIYWLISFGRYLSDNNRLNNYLREFTFQRGSVWGIITVLLLLPAIYYLYTCAENPFGLVISQAQDYLQYPQIWLPLLVYIVLEGLTTKIKKVLPHLENKNQYSVYVLLVNALDLFDQYSDLELDSTYQIKKNLQYYYKEDYIESEFIALKKKFYKNGADVNKQFILLQNIYHKNIQLKNNWNKKENASKIKIYAKLGERFAMLNSKQLIPAHWDYLRERIQKEFDFFEQIPNDKLNNKQKSRLDKEHHYLSLFISKDKKAFYLKVKELLDEEYWTKNTNEYKEQQHINTRYKEFLKTFLTKDWFSDVKAAEAFYTEISELVHNTNQKLSLRNDIHLQKVAQEIKEKGIFTHDLWDKTERAKQEKEFKEVVQYWEERRDKNLHTDELTKLRRAVNHWRTVVLNPLEYFGYDRDKLIEIIQEYENPDTYLQYVGRYTIKSREKIQEYIITTAKELKEKDYPIKECIILYERSIENITCHLKRIKRGRTKTYYNGSNSYSSSSSSSSSSYSSYSDYSSSYSDYSDYSDSSWGGGSSGGGGASGSW
ncbi:MAG: TPM domain-containing protein [Saprospiraceae bacterium]|nr:TPM domain-containing protein [Saprospiraceae bacterium]